MRGALIISLMLILFTPACSAMQPIVPAVTMTLQPSSVNVTSTPTQKSSVDFCGTVTLDKLPMERIVVGLTPSVDAGWASSCSPSSMVITDEQPHQFTCTVVVPEATANHTGTLTVDATARGGGFSVTQSVTALIIVTGPPIYIPPPHNNTQNDTGQNQTSLTNGTGPADDESGVGPFSPYLMPASILVVVAVAGSGTYLGYRKWKGQP